MDTAEGSPGTVRDLALAPRRPLEILIALLGLFCLASLAIAVGGRIGFEWPLEWMEGALLQHALELRAPGPLYRAPSAGFTPFIYAPLAYLPMAASTLVFGETLFAVRLPSLLATLATLVLLARSAARSSATRSAGWLAAGLWAAGYAYCGAFYDLARIDACFVLLVVAGAERLEAGHSRVALVLFALSAFAKQQGLMFLGVAGAWVIWREGLRGWRKPAAALGASAAGFVALHLQSSGWSTRYIFEFPAEQPVNRALLVPYFRDEVLFALPLLVAAVGARWLRRRHPPTAIDLLIPAGLVASALGRIHVGGFDNVRMAGFALLILGGAPRIGVWLKSPALSWPRSLLLGAALVFQFALLWREPTSHWPLPEAAKQFSALRAALLRCAGSGRGVALDHSLIAGAPYSHAMALLDLHATGDEELIDTVMGSMERNLSRRRGPTAIAVGFRFARLENVLAQRFEVCDAPEQPHLATGVSPPGAIVYRRRGS